MSDQNEQITYLKDYRASAYVLPELALTFRIEDGRTEVEARLRIVPDTAAARGAPLRLDGEELDLKRIAIDGKDLAPDAYTTDAAGLTLPKVPAAPFTLETTVEIAPEANTRLMGLYRSNGIWCTQCEAEGFRRITYFLDRPDILSRYTVRIEADKSEAPVLLSNGNCLETGDLPGGRHYAVWQDPFPKPSYLFALVAGKLERLAGSFVSMSGREIDLGIYVEPGKVERAHHAMASLKRAMKWDEERFGREYDLDLFNIVAVSDFNFGAMENKGLNIFNDRYILADAGSATDADYQRIEGIIAHEYFHNWTGNRITCRDWFQLCLKEGLTVYRDQEFTSDVHSRSVKRIEDVRTLRAAQFPEDAGPLAHPARPDAYRQIDNFYTATVYDKGAEIVRMLATLLGPEEFRKGTDLYFERHDGEATTIEAWLQVFEDATGRDLSQFGQWYTQAGTPQVTIADEWDAESRTYTLRLGQHTAPTPGQPDKQPMVVPIRFGLVGPNGNDLEWSSVSGADVSGDMIVMDTEHAEIVFKGLSNQPVPSLFRGFSAPVRIASDLEAPDKLFLARHDADPFNRWQALQDIALDLLVEASRRGGSYEGMTEVVDDLAEALGDTLADEALDDAFKAQALILPGEGAIAQGLREHVDPDAVHTARRELARRIGAALTAELVAQYDKLASVAVPYSMTPAAVRARSLRNQCLALRSAGDAAVAPDLLAGHYDGADNVTDRMAALSGAVAVSAANVFALLAAFRQSYGADPLLFDKWLALNASMPDDGCLERVETLYAAPDFPKTNPNRMRALVGTFAMGNPAQFGRADGAGFRFVTRVCREIDGINPQLAARLLTAFRVWRAYEPQRRQAAQRALTDLRAGGPLSRHVGDILTRTLAD